MIDRFGREINYLRISVTDRCNLRCRYCMPAEGISLLRHCDILSLEEIIDVTVCAVEMGIKKIRLTGGEPLVRKGIFNLVQSIAAIEGIEDFAMTTNGILLSKYARPLADAGLKRVNISLDTIDQRQYRMLTRCGNIKDVFTGINAARKAGLNPVKLNCVVGRFSRESDPQAVKEFGKTNGMKVRIIQQMSLESGSFSVVEGGSGGDCMRCNRLRLSSDGKVRPCLFSDIYFDVRQLGPEQALKAAVAHKPEAGGPCIHNLMHRIGG
ncbi:MAG: radical SAM protein [Sedimentisphaerales bacterium]|nr:radical SAM protein [Sedimentisphaerales bacterium]